MTETLTVIWPAWWRDACPVFDAAKTSPGEPRLTPWQLQRTPSTGE